jgi:hypothetical protein
LKTFWPRRSVTLPTVQPVAPAVAAAELQQLQARIDSIEKRIADRERR